MNSDSSSMLDVEECLTSIGEQNENFDNSILNTTTSCDGDSSSNEVEIVKELKVSLDKHECDLCCAGLFLVNKLWQFGGILNDENKYACDICHTGFKTKGDINKHKKLHEEGLLPEDVDIPNLASFVNTSNNSHEIGSTTPSTSRKKRNSSPPLMCDICLNFFKSQRTLETHKMNMHSNTVFTCEICDSKFSKFNMFKKHCKIHKNSDTLLICPTCKKQFLYKKSLKNHVCALK